MEIVVLEKFILPIILALITLLGTIITFNYRNKSKELPEDKIKREFTLGIQDISRIYSIMDSMERENPDIVRVAVVKVHNGGFMPKPIGPLYLTVLFEHCATQVEPMIDKLQKIPIDRFHLDIIVKPLLIEEKVLVDKETANGYLKQIYEADGIEYGYAEQLVLQEDCLIYALVNFREGSPKNVTGRQYVNLQSSINTIRNLMKSYKRQQ